MKKNIFLFLLGLILPLTVNATDATIKCNSDSNKLITNSVFTCDVIVNPSTNLTSFKTNIDYSTSDFTLTKITPSNNWISSDETLLNLVKDSSLEEETIKELTIAKLEFKVKSNASYGTKTIKLRGYDLEKEVSTTVNILSSNSLLKSLTIEGIEFNFKSNAKTYNLTTTKETIKVTAVAYDSKATFPSGYGSRSVNLNYGDNTIQIIVVAENGTNTVYTLNIKRTDQRSSNNNLSSLKVGNYDLIPSFNKNNLTYQVSVLESEKEVELTATLESKTSYFVKDYGPRTVSLQTGLNTFEIKVRAENDTIKTYTINITKSEKSSNNYLKSITLSNATIKFAKTIFEYNINVLYDVLEMDVKAEAENDKAKVDIIGNKSLFLGKNIYTINVTAENGNVLTYKIIINRLEEGKKLSTNTNLEDLIIKNYPIDFSQDNLEYNITIKDEERLTITYSLEEDTSFVTVVGNENLKNGSKINIIVTSESNTTKTYTINITKEEKNSYLIYINLSTLLILLISLVIIFRKKIFKPKMKQIISGDLQLGKSKLVINKKSKDPILDKEAEITIVPKEEEIKK